MIKYDIICYIKKECDNLSSTNNFIEGNIAKKLIKFMLPILASLVLQAMYGAIAFFIWYFN